MVERGGYIRRGYFALRGCFCFSCLWVCLLGFFGIDGEQERYGYALFVYIYHISTTSILLIQNFGVFPQSLPRFL